MKVFVHLFILVFMLTTSTAVYADSPPINVGHFNKRAMNGYDVMTYWRGGNPTEGNPDISFEYMGATWVFVSGENRAAFAENPAAYAPRYGGYCAYAAARGYTADVDPFAWQIYKNHLYLNYSPRVQRSWGSDIDENIKNADAIWPAPLDN